MELQFSQDVQEKLDRMAQDTGTPGDELVRAVVADFFDDLAVARQTLDRRYDDLASDRVEPIPGEEVFARLRARSAARRSQRQ